MPNTQKRDIVSEITSIIKDGANFALVTFEKTTHKSLEDLRKQLRTSNAQMNVVKNTLFEKAVNKLSESDHIFATIRAKEFPLKQRTALITFSGEWADGLKTYFNFSKEDESFGFKFGRIDTTFYDNTDLLKLAQLPGRDQLRTQLIGAMKSPMSRTTRALTFNMQKLVFILNSKTKN